VNTTRYFKLGLFILLTVGALVAGAISLGAARMFGKSVLVETSFDESVAGLEVGAPVKHRGVTIGHVESIRFPDNPTDDRSATTEPFRYIVVEMAFDPHVVADIRANRLKQTLDRMVASGLRARVVQAGITGGAYIELNYMDPIRYPIAMGSARTQDLYVPSAPGALNQVVDAITDIATKLQRANLDQVVAHADSLIVHVDQSVQDLRVAELQPKASAILDHIQSASARLVQILNDPQVAHVIADLPQITGRVRDVSARVDELIMNGRFDQSAKHLERTLAEAERLLASQSDNVRAILTDLRETMANARELTEDVKANPSQLIFGQPPARTAYGSSK
jgi:ABC-type transporter Mla subunit MlaD